MAELTDMQARFVDFYVSDPASLGDHAKAAELAGYAPQSARVQGCQLLKKRHVKVAVDEALRDQISGPLASKAVDVLREIVHDKDATQKIRLEASRTILDRSGIIAPRAAEQKPSGSQTDLTSLSMEELEEFILQGQKSLSQGREPGANLSVVNG